MSAAEGRKRRGVAIDNLAVTGRFLDFDELVTGGENGDLRAAVYRDNALLHRREYRHLAGAAFGAGVDNGLANAHILAGAPDVFALFFDVEDLYPVSLATGVLDGHNGVGAFGHGRAGHDAAGLAAVHGLLRDRPGGDVF